VNAPVVLTEPQLQKILDAISSIQTGGIGWQTFLPVFLGALSGIIVGIILESYKEFVRKKNAELNKRRAELTEINIAMVALASQLELLLHFAFQIVIPHFNDTHVAYERISKWTKTDQDMSELIALINRDHPRMMMTAPELTLVEHDFFGRLSFAIEKEPDLLQQANWLRQLTRDLRQKLQDRNSHIEIALSEAKKGPVNFGTVSGTVQVQDSVAISEVITLLQAIEQIQKVAQTLERIGRGYRDVGQPKRLVSPQATEKAVKCLRSIAEPHIQSMSDRH
jgi:hypothetical protein